MKKMMTICAECKKELTAACKSTGNAAPVTTVLTEEVIYSHGICFECAVKLYGAEFMGKLCANQNYCKAETP